MSKRRTSGVQRRASPEALARRVDQRRPVDWRVVAIGAALVVAAIIAVLVALSSGTSAHAGTPQPNDGAGHVPLCEPGNYSSVPPTSGCHIDPPAEWGVYSSAQDEVQLIHNLEHGGIVIWYDPEELDAEDVSELADLVDSQTSQGIGGRFKFILSPWEGEDFGHPIAVTAWRQLLYLDAADMVAVRGFSDAHYGQAPEPQGGPPPPR